jgi:HEAT repeat protein
VLKKLDKEKLLNDIRAKGVEISNINDLMKMDKRFKDLVPIVVEHLKNIDDESDKEFLVRCLGAKGFTEATEQLLAEFYKTDKVTFKWAVGNSISIIEDKSILNELLEIVQNKEHGIARQMIVVGIGKMKAKEAFPVLLNLLKDEDVVGHTISALAYYKDPTVIQYLEPLKSHKVGWVKKEASKVIEKLQKL